MENEVNSLIHVGFIWRLETEKGIDILVQVLERVQSDKELRNTLVFHIIWVGSFFEDLEKIKKNWNIHLHIYGKLSHNEVLTEIKKWDLLCMPSRFLETFWLVALEALSEWVRVCWPKVGGLKELISPGLDISMKHPVEDILKILIRIHHDTNIIQDSLIQYSYWNWKKNLEWIIQDRKNILIIHDYNRVIWWAEVYIDFLQHEIRSSGWHVKRFWHTGSISRVSRIIQAVIAPLAFWRYFEVKNIIQKSHADLIWIHSILRYIWPWWILAIMRSNREVIMSHHDLGLIVPRPSKLESEDQIPHVLSLKDFVRNSQNPLEWILRSIKYIYIKLIWILLEWISTHIVPSDFMKLPLSDLSGKKTLVFPHTLIHTRGSISEKESI
jgi:glycosyltransferase involved in cell wall biosynthesis